MKVYSVTTGIQTVSVIQDLIELTAASTRAIQILEVVVAQISDYGDAEAETIFMGLVRMSAAYTSGSGGSSVTPSLYGSDDLPAADATCERNNTTLATGGTINTLVSFGFNVQSGFHWLPPPDLRVNIAPTDAFVVRLSTTGLPADELSMVCTVVFEET